MQCLNGGLHNDGASHATTASFLGSILDNVVR